MAVEFDISKLPTNVKELHPSLVIGYLKLLRRVRAATKGSAMVRKKWRVLCIPCGTEFTIPQNYLVRRPNPKTHCGCQNKTLRSENQREHRIWTMMRVRCTDVRHVAFHHYGGRGIKVCPQWFDKETGFAHFLEDLGPAPTDTHSLDRIDVDGNYEPGNVRWATPKEQAQNTRRAKQKFGKAAAYAAEALEKANAEEAARTEAETV